MFRNMYLDVFRNMYLDMFRNIQYYDYVTKNILFLLFFTINLMMLSLLF